MVSCQPLCFVEVPQASAECAREEAEEDEEQRWERERKERLETRQKEQEDAREKVLQELEKLEKEEVIIILHQVLLNPLFTKKGQTCHMNIDGIYV